MITLDRDCEELRPFLGALVDGELPGAERLHIAAHLGHCGRCRAEVESLRRVGRLLREAVAATAEPEMSGLCGGVLSRVRAEEAVSWRAMLARAVEDWHWAIVGLGSLMATGVSTMLVWAVLWFGPAPERGDSLAAMLNGLNTRRHVTSFVVTPQDLGVEAFDTLDGGVGSSLRPGVFRAGFFPRPSERELVDALAAAFTREGRLISLDSMSIEARQRTENLLGQIQVIRTSAQAQDIRLFTSTRVSARASYGSY
jgi:hypothetical protein